MNTEERGWMIGDAKKLIAAAVFWLAILACMVLGGTVLHPFISAIFAQ